MDGAAGGHYGRSGFGMIPILHTPLPQRSLLDSKNNRLTKIKVDGNCVFISEEIYALSSLCNYNTKTRLFIEKSTVILFDV